MNYNFNSLMDKTCIKTRIAIMETKLNDIDEKLDMHISDQKEHEEKVEVKLDAANELVEKRFIESQKTMNDFIQRADVTYAPYSLMTIAKGAGIGAVVIIIYYILNHVGLPTF
jgi:hypothetical protein